MKNIKKNFARFINRVKLGYYNFWDTLYELWMEDAILREDEKEQAKLYKKYDKYCIKYEKCLDIENQFEEEEEAMKKGA
jgi:hypothetical protein